MGNIGKFQLVTATMVVLALIRQAPVMRPVHAKGQVESNQEKLERLRRQYSFQELLDGKPEAVANAKEIFALSDDPKIKQRVASILLRIGKGDQVHYDYLVAEAEKSLEYANSMPWPTLYDKNGNIVPKKVNPAFLKWCQARKLNALETVEAAYYTVPIPWLNLAGAGDPRAYDLLIKGLHSSNVAISASAAEGLARLQASQAIDEIIAVGFRAPLEARSWIGRVLLFFPRCEGANRCGCINQG